MNRSNRFLVAAPVVAVALCLPVSLSAMPFRQFDAMNKMDQAEYIAVIVDTTQRVLRVSGGANYAAQFEQLFVIKPGDTISDGLAELELNIIRARVADAKRAAKDPKARRFDVEVALLVTLKKNNIPITQPFVNAVNNALANFHCMTNAEFEAETPAEQRRYIALLAKIGYLHVAFLDEMEEMEKSKKPGAAPFKPDAGERKLVVVLMAQQFPNGSTDQPGFAEVVKKIRIDYARAPNAHGPMYAVVVYLLELEDAALGKQMQQMRDETGHYQEEDGERNAPPPPAAEPAAATPPAAAPPAAEPAAPPPPAAAPAAPPTSPPSDDPSGGGGLITPPTTFNALLCVSADLASNSEWSNPAGGSKMDTFKHQVGSYVNSVAKPGWEYWIMPGQYERFDPATTSSGAQFVSVVSPDSGRFDEFNPKCPSGYAAFWVKVSH